MFAALLLLALISLADQAQANVLPRQSTLAANPTTSTIPVAPTATATATATETTQGTGISPSGFGLVFVNSAETPSQAGRIQRGAQTGASLDRFPFYWDRIETGYGVYDWSRQDAAVRANEAQGLGTLAILLGTPGHYRGGIRSSDGKEENAEGESAGELDEWTPLPIGGSYVRLAGAVQSRSDCYPWEGPPPPSGLWNPIFQDGTDQPAPGKAINPDNPWARFVYLTVARYRPGGVAGTNVRHWEIWNEPDLCHFWSGTPEAYARLLKVAYLAARQADPQAFILWGGLAHFANGDFLTRMLAALRADPQAAQHRGFFDAAASHQYSLSYLGLSYTARIRDALAETGWGHKPIWITESGVPVCDDFPGPRCPSPWRATAEEQASYIWQNVAYTRLGGGGPIFHFMLHDDCGNVVAVDSPDGFGLHKNESSSYCSPADASGRLSASAFRLANRYFSDTEVVWADIQAQVARRVAFFHGPSGERRLLTFAVTGQPALARIPAAGSQARRIGLDGSETVITPTGGFYEVPLAGATNRNWPNSNGGYDMGIYGTPWLLVEKDTLPPTAGVAALPAASPERFAVNWWATDWGAGVASVELWAQVDGGEWSLWREGLTAGGSLTYTGVLSQEIAFAAVGIDRLGQVSRTLTAQARTVITATPPPPTAARVTGRVIDPAGQAVVSGTVTVGAVAATTDVRGAFTLTVPFGRWDVAVNGQVINRGRDFQTDALLMLLYATGGNRVVNGDFESGASGWNASGSSPSAVEQQPGTSDHALRLATAFVPNPGVPGAEGSNGGNSTWSQTVDIPTGRPFLALAYHVQSQESSTEHDKFEIIVAAEGRSPAYLLTQHTSSPWQYRFFDLSSFAGQRATLILNVYETSPHRRTSALVDQVVIGDVAAQPTAPSYFLYVPGVSK